MRKIITLAVATLLSLSAFADDFNLYYDTTAGDTGKKIESIANLQKIKFENGNLVCVRTDGTTQTLAISSVRRLFFSTDTSIVAIDEVKEESADNGQDEIYDLMGRKLELSKKDLPKGIYIVNGKKLLVK